MHRVRRSEVLMQAVGAFLLGSALLVGCQPAQPAATPKPAEKAAATPTKAAEKAAEKPVRGGTLIVAANSERAALDPYAGSDSNAGPLMFETLIYQDAKFNLTKEGLAKDWTVSGDGKAITFKLREGVKFHDGTDFDAAAVKFNIEMVKDPATKANARSNYTSVASVEVVDPLTVKFNLSRTDAMLLGYLASGTGLYASPTAVKKYGQDFGRNPVGTGPFQFVEWRQGDHITVKRFDGYWGKDKDGNQLPYLDQVVVRIIMDETVGAATLRTGDVYRAFIPLDQWPQVKGDSNFTTDMRPWPNIELVEMNNKRPPFNNKALREAVALVVDREGMAAVGGEGAFSHASVMSPVFWGYDPKIGVFPARDLAKAKAKMAEAGYPAGGLKVKLVTQNRDYMLKANQILKANLAELGIEADIQVVAQAEHSAYYSTSEGSDKFDIMYYMTPTTSGADPGEVFNTFFHSQGARNTLGPYGNSQVDQLLDKARSIYDQKERAALYQEAAKIIREDMPAVPLYIRNLLFGMSKKVRNYVYTSVASPFGTKGFREVWLAQ